MVRRLISSTRAADAVDLGGIADAHLVLGDQEQPRDDVLDQRLRAEADRQADDAGAGQHRRDVDIELPQHHQDRGGPDQDREEPPQRGADRMQRACAARAS